VGVIATQFFSDSTVTFLVLGMATGALYALVALGVVLVYRASGVLNFAAGALGAVAAYVFYYLRDQQGVNWIVALVIALALGAALGVFARMIVMGLLHRASLLAKLIATLGLLTIAQSFLELSPSLFNGFLEFPTGTLPTSFLPQDSVSLGGEISVSLERLILIGMAVVLAVVLRLVYSKTKFGLATSAVAENRRVAAANGLSPTTIEVANFALAGLLSAIAAILLAPVVSLDVAALSLLVIPAIAAALAGRFSSFGVTVFAALGIGVISTELQLFSPDMARILGTDVSTIGALPQVVPLLIIVLVTVFSGRGRLQRGEIMARLPLPGNGRVSPVLVGAGTAIGIGMLLLLSKTWADALVITFATGILVLSVVVVTGYGGQLSLGQFALAGFGAWVATRLSDTQGLSFELALVVGVLATIPVGLVFALPALRTRGVNLAVTTLALSLMMSAIVFQNSELTGGFGGTSVKAATFLGLELDPIGHPERYGIFVLVMFVLVGLVVANLRRGRAGRRLLAVRGNERAAASLGIGVYGAKLYSFALGSAIAAVAGVLLAFRTTNVQFITFDVFGSINAVLYAVLGGIGWAAGAVIGAINAAGGVAATALSQVFAGINRVESWLLLISGVGVIAILKQSPDGLAALFARQLGPRLRRLQLSDREAEPLPRRDRPPASLEVLGITVTFGGVRALDDVSFTVPPGEIVGLIGPNGAGKTTLLDVVTGFTKQQQGSVLLDGASVDGWSPEHRARSGMGRSWQAVELFEEMSVRENLLTAADRQQWRRYLVDLVRPGRPATTEAMREVIEEFELSQFLDERPSSLPQGTSRLVGIARTMVTEPSTLLLDEPAAGLDATESVELGEAIRLVARTHGTGILVIEHDVSLLLSICDRIVVLDFGRKIAEGTPDEIARNPDVIRAYLGEPDRGASVESNETMEPAP
jgi:ABC-type branched-subunit amino acid transport system ATPase component/ABC-type branched-subunit amino acid transport system permease subunit